MNAIAAQDPWELRQLKRLLMELQPGYLCEIGVKQAGWILGVGLFLQEGAHVVGIDIADIWGAQRRLVRDALRDCNIRFDLIIGDSADPNTRDRLCAILPALDLLHIDGNHSYESCRRDYELYSPLVRVGGLVVLHDVFHARDKGVRRFWEELRAGRHGPFARSWEWFHPRPVRPNGDGPMGIGVVERGNP